MAFWDWMRGRGKRPLTADLQRERPDTPLLPAAPDADESPRKRTVQLELPSLGVGLWTVDRVFAALEQHDLGNFRASAPLASAALRDPRVRGPFSIRTQAITELPIAFKPANDSPTARLAAEIATRQWRQWISEKEAEKFHRNVVMFGAGLAQIVWLTDRTPWEPRVHVWNNGYLWWNWDGVRNFGRWHLTTREGDIEPVPGDGEWIFGRQCEKDPWIEGLIRSIGLRFIARQLGAAGWSKFNQKYALAILKLRTPQQADQTVVDVIEGQLRSDGNPVATLPWGDEDNRYDLDWEEINSSTGWQSFDRSMDAFGAELAIDILGQSMTTETGSSGGTHGVAKAKSGLMASLKKADAKMLATIYYEQLLRPWAAFNWHDPNLAPIPIDPTDESEDLTSTANALQALGNALNAFKEAGVNVDGDALLKQFGVPVKSKAPAGTGESLS